MALVSWLCSKNNTENQFVKLVYPGDRVELLDGPVLAAEIMMRHPRFCVTHPEVFHEPSAVAPPDMVLSLGHKYYLVPTSTVRKLQRRSPRSKRLGSPHVHNSSPSLTPKWQVSSCHDKAHKTGKKWFKCLPRSRAKAKRTEGMSHGSNGVGPFEIDMKRANENWKMGLRGSPGQHRGQGSSLGTPSSSWHPRLESITEE